MPFLKFTRDKRGYENFYLMQPTARGKSRPRVLYWFRTPPNVRVGRVAFDPEVRRALEAQNPDVAFDWTAIVETPIPTADTERWRERRRVERAMRAASSDDTVDEGGDPERPAGPSAPERRVEPVTARQIVEMALDPSPALSVMAGEPEADTTGDPPTASNEPSPAPEPSASAHRRKRRRRGRRKGQSPNPGFQAPESEGSARPETTPASGPAANDPETSDEKWEP